MGGFWFICFYFVLHELKTIFGEYFLNITKISVLLQVKTLFTHQLIIFFRLLNFSLNVGGL